METASPLRYPGGKSALTDLLRQIRRLNNLGNTAVAEPFAGGAGASLSLLFLEETHKIYINDFDSAIHDLWWAIVNKPTEFANMVSRTEVSIKEWHRQKQTLRSTQRVSRLRRGFSAFYLNRCNRSGIIANGGPIGGTHQKGRWKLDARFNKTALQARCLKVAEYRDRISVTGIDGIKFLENYGSDDTFLFVDPPYFVKGGLLYLNSLSEEYHEALAHCLKDLPSVPWVVTYDDCPQIRRLYKDWATIRPFSLRYSAAAKTTGREILITPKWLRLPSRQASSAIVW